MNLALNSPLLRAVLWADAASSTAIAGLQLAGGDGFAHLLGISPTVLFESNFILAAAVALAAWLAASRSMARPGLLMLVVGNVLWVLGCVGLLAGGGAANGWGQAYLLVQAVAVGAIAAVEAAGLRDAPVHRMA